MEGQSSLSSYMHMLAAGYPLMYEVNPELADLTDTSVGKLLFKFVIQRRNKTTKKKTS